MNGNHSSRHGRFCTRSEGRSVNPVGDGLEGEALEKELLEQARRTACLHADALASGGRCLIARHPSGVIEFFVLSGEGYEAYRGMTAKRAALPKRRGRVGGVQDGHNIRRGIRRWIERNADIIDREDIFLQVVRGDDGVLSLSAVAEA